MVIQAVGYYFHIHQLVGGNAAQSALVFYCYAALFVHHVYVERLSEFERKIEVADGLYKKADGVYLIPLLRELHQIGYEDDGYRLVQLAQLDRAVHTVHFGHLNVHKHHGIDRLVVRKEVRRVWISA